MIGEKTEKTEEFWRRACSTKDGEFRSKFPEIDGADYHCLTFGSPKYQDYSDHITELAIKGIKRATAHLKIDFEINKGEIFGLLGPNGAGKSVTFNVLLGIMKADQGNVFVEGTKITDFAIHERAKKFKIGYIPQNDSVFKGLSCINNLKAIAEITIKDRVKQESIVQELLSEFNLSHLRNILGKKEIAA